MRLWLVRGVVRRLSKNARFPVPGRWQCEQFASSQARARSSSEAGGSSGAWARRSVGGGAGRRPEEGGGGGGGGREDAERAPRRELVVGATGRRVGEVAVQLVGPDAEGAARAQDVAGKALAAGG